MSNLQDKTQEELKALWKSTKLSIVGGPTLNQETINKLTIYLLEVQSFIEGDLPQIDSLVLTNSLN